MNVKEAIDNVESCVHFAMSDYNTGPEEDAYDEEALTIAIEAMKKQEPMKPIPSDGEYDCPMCELTVAENDEYCWHCGQKLDWED